MPNRWVMLLVLFIARTAMGFQFQSVASVSPLLVQDLAIDLALFGSLIGAWMLPGAVMAIPSGVLGGRFGDKRVALLGLVLMVIGSAVTAGTDGYLTALVGRIVSGTGAVLLNVLLAKWSRTGLATVTSRLRWASWLSAGPWESGLRWSCSGLCR
jgi:predicted MFS family arabinose efflux permease